MLRYILLKLLMLVVFVGMLVSCNTSQTISPVTVFDHNAHQPLAMNSRRLEIIDNWQMPIADPYVGHRVNPLPSNIVAEWASHVLQPAGGSGEIIFDIKRVAVTMIDLPQKVDLNGLFEDQQNRKIQAEIKAQIMWLQPVGGNQALIELEASHSITIRESANPNEVSQKTHEAVKGALIRLDNQARKELAKIDKITLS